MGESSQSIPVLRWLGTWSPYGRTFSKEPSPASSSSNLSSPSLVSLNEALHEPLCLPRRPPSAQLPHFSLARHPPFLDSLTRSTLPTASLSPEANIFSSNSSPPPSPTSRTRSGASFNDSKFHLNHSPPSRSSLDSLRSVSQRDFTLRHSHKRTASTAATVSPSELESNTSWWWFQSGNKDNVDTLLAEEDRAATVREEQDNIRKKYQCPRNPIVFCHGLLGFDSVTIGPSIAPISLNHWRGVQEVLEANGAEVLITRVPATSSPIERAKVLEQKVSETYPGRKVHLIGHSMGGIDCRYLTTHLTKRKFSVLSITTVATPHRGSSFADHFLATLGKGRMDSFLSLLDLLPNGGGDGTAFECLTLESMRKFNENVPDVPGVKYFSWGSVYEPGLVDTWKWPHSVVLEKEGPNDGLVSVRSAKWGKYMGTLQNVNHLDLVGWINPARFKWAEMTGKQINFRPATFYLGIADMLAKEVDGVVDEDGNGNGNGGSKAGEGANVRSDDLNDSNRTVHSRSQYIDQVASNSLETNRTQNSDSSSPGPTELMFAADEGEVIDDVVLRTEPTTTCPSPRTNSPVPPTPPPEDHAFPDQRSTLDEESYRPVQLDLETSRTSVDHTTNPMEKKTDAFLPNWTSLVSDSLASLVSRSSSPSSSCKPVTAGTTSSYR
ncbi:Alpha/Beta hydrolase protein [Lentinula aff. detonsa]|uniref:Alpha/Beta hydrolase protein n=1 Tax=Lentinula aff. detonsa TaxID=2804958 RepID=A0AA38L520_9AGAR|nr:Alpha/Beta hydrolase protein [Lentinula aff. detonsa]